jgi:hypothetical protein
MGVVYFYIFGWAMRGGVGYVMVGIGLVQSNKTSF